VVSFGLHGGAEWHGASVIPEDNKLFVAVNMIPWVVRLYLQAAPDYQYADSANAGAHAVYSRQCAACHLASRNGQFETVGEVATTRIPSLHGYTMGADNAWLFQLERFRRDHPKLSVTQPQLDSIWSLFKAWDRDVLAKNKAVWAFHWRQLVDSVGLPASAPPWGKVVALDLSTGKKAWEQPYGLKVIGGDTLQTGSASYGGLISTSGKVLFATGTDDDNVVAIDAVTGKTLWRYKMAAAGSAPPMTFSYQGKQYVCVIATGGRFKSFLNHASKLYIFVL
jgi:quinoprotein glucose dehydrogenase